MTENNHSISPTRKWDNHVEKSSQIVAPYSRTHSSIPRVITIKTSLSLPKIWMNAADFVKECHNKRQHTPDTFRLSNSVQSNLSQKKFAIGAKRLVSFNDAAVMNG